MIYGCGNIFVVRMRFSPENASPIITDSSQCGYPIALQFRRLLLILWCSRVVNKDSCLVLQVVGLRTYRELDIKNQFI